MLRRRQSNWLKFVVHLFLLPFEGPKPSYDEPDYPSSEVTSAQQQQQHPQSSQHQLASNLRRELPKDLSDEALKREAGL